MDITADPALGSDLLGDRASRAADLVKVLGHPLRLRLVALLCAAPMHVNGLADHLGVRPAIVSQHLRLLRGLELVATQRADGRVTYSVTQPRLGELVRCVVGCLASERPRRRVSR
jgi:DNA-binding transcriptional ArsR family regulator